MNAIHTLYTNGIVRSADGKLIAVVDSQNGNGFIKVIIDGYPEDFYAVDMEHAMDIIAEKTKAHPI